MDVICYLFKNSLLVATGGTRIQWVVNILYMEKSMEKSGRGDTLVSYVNAPSPYKRTACVFCGVAHLDE